MLTKFHALVFKEQIAINGIAKLKGTCGVKAKTALDKVNQTLKTLFKAIAIVEKEHNYVSSILLKQKECLRAEMGLQESLAICVCALVLPKGKVHSPYILMTGDSFTTWSMDSL